MTPWLSTRHPFRGAAAALATRHGKERLMGPVLATAGLAVEVAPVDTDAFGTFSGEVPRPGPPEQVVVAKARAAMAVSGRHIGVASEGTFAPMPGTPWVTADVELVTVVDDRVGLAVTERAHAPMPLVAVHVLPDDRAALARVAGGIRRQAVIVRPTTGGPDGITKGVADPDALASAVARAASVSVDGRATIEADLRAHLCPPRRVVIATATRRLADRLRRSCPSCAAPGFGYGTTELGLPCGGCGLPSGEVRATTESCPTCGYQEVRLVPGVADPARCRWCNP